MLDISVQVDYDEVLYAMGTYDRTKFFKLCQEEGYISEGCIIEKGVVSTKTDPEDDEFSIACKKLIGEGWRISSEEKDIIIKISQKFIK